MQRSLAFVSRKIGPSSRIAPEARTRFAQSSGGSEQLVDYYDVQRSSDLLLLTPYAPALRLKSGQVPSDLQPEPPSEHLSYISFNFQVVLL